MAQLDIDPSARSWGIIKSYLNQRKGDLSKALASIKSTPQEDLVLKGRIAEINQLLLSVEPPNNQG